VVSLLVLIFLVVVMLLPVLMVILESKANKVSDKDHEENHEQKKTFINKIWAHYQYGLRKATPAHLFFATTQFKYL
jgi:ABC-type transport system involved in cytochrome bd biosynthesis fused ATPase/permease subunit